MLFTYGAETPKTAKIFELVCVYEFNMSLIYI